MNYPVYLIFFLGFISGVFLGGVFAYFFGSALSRGKIEDLQNQVWYYEQYLDGIVPFPKHGKEKK